ncbi:ABC transporter permease subunit [Umezawaea endophytica]|uniref:ABC transporter permease subunit n=1 Tax=Umezawaea endophytica TaxID=1654476 RepID=A0A9X3AJH3_9PSEU|nr:ABC transporter permease subunit [Umezawaea endophytica]MCS7484006.1 ABC transporter permease subunit [Umezawaea endophytica]
MTWVAWRQQRLLTLVSLGLVAVVAAGMAWLWADVSSVLPMDLGPLGERYSDFLSYVPMVMLVLPVLLGMFAGAPVFARELEQGTHVFGLTQSVGRGRWWATKLLVAGVPVTVAMTLLGLLNAKALGPLSFIMTSRLQTPMFESQGIVLGMYTAFAFALGATAGLLVRGTLGAMAVTIGGYLALLVVVGNAARPHYATPEFTASGSADPGVWRVEIGYLDALGKPMNFAAGDCGLDSFPKCMADQGIASQFTRFHPVERFWDFQLLESGIFVLAAAALLGAGAWAVRRIH